MAKDCGCPGGNKAADALYLLGLIERHGWSVMPSNVEPGAWFISSVNGHIQGHRAPTLIEALTAASNCPRCTGGET